MRGDLLPSKKKKPFPVSDAFQAYLDEQHRVVELPLEYDDLLRYTDSIPLLDFDGNDTLWETVFYPQSETQEINDGLRMIYALLKTDGDVQVLEHLTIARIDFCAFGNSQPFRVRIINRLNDNYDHFYVKRTDSSRVFGLELEDMLSPNRVTYLLNGVP
jgi:hypothetical protein